MHAPHREPEVFCSRSARGAESAGHRLGISFAAVPSSSRAAGALGLSFVRDGSGAQLWETYLFRCWGRKTEKRRGQCFPT
ncbi:hypothetical protein H8959_019880, partial [Pygathrix nigripes]